MNYSDGVYAIDSDAGNSLDSEKNILSWLVCSHMYPPLFGVFT